VATDGGGAASTGANTLPADNDADVAAAVAAIDRGNGLACSSGAALVPKVGAEAGGSSARWNCDCRDAAASANAEVGCSAGTALANAGSARLPKEGEVRENVDEKVGTVKVLDAWEIEEGSDGLVDDVTADVGTGTDVDDTTGADDKDVVPDDVVEARLKGLLLCSKDENGKRAVGRDVGAAICVEGGGMMLPVIGKGRTDDGAHAVVGFAAVTAEDKGKLVTGTAALVGCGMAKLEEKVWVGTLEEGRRGPAEPVGAGVEVSTRNTCNGAGAGIVVSCWSLLRSKADRGRPPIIQAISSFTSLLSLSSLAAPMTTGTGTGT
jgi:hypothetical protein